MLSRNTQIDASQKEYGTLNVRDNAFVINERYKHVKVIVAPFELH